MNRDDTKKNKLAIYLLKDGSSEEILSNRARRIDIGSDGNLELYVGESVKNRPKFLQDFFLRADIDNIYTASARALLIVKDVSGKDFAITFGVGRSLFDNSAIERDFGIKVAMNTIDPENIKNINKVTLDTNPANSQFQRSITTNSSEFNIDSDYDLAKKISGRVKAEYKNTLGDIVEGGDSLILKVKYDIRTVREVLRQILDIYAQNDYAEVFPWFENARVIKDKGLLCSLDNDVISKLNGRSSDERIKVWASAPEFLDLEYLEGYVVGKKENAIPKLNLSTEDILEQMPSDFNIENLKNKKVYAVSVDGGTRLKSWTAYKCLYSEVTRNNKVYLLVEGFWYTLKQDFVNEINERYHAVPVLAEQFPDFDPNTHAGENGYNEALSVALGGQCLDRKVIFYGGSHNKIEICDIVTNESLIHTKIYGYSSTLSHLFQQGLTSGTLLKSDGNFERVAISQLSDRYGIQIGSLVRRRIVFCIISKHTRNFEIPFFSKISLCHAKRNLEALGFEVYLKIVKQLATVPSSEH